MLIVISIPIALTLLFQSSSVQTITAKLVTNMLSESLEQEINVNAISFSIFSGVKAEGLYLKDHHNNIMIGVDKLSAKPIIRDFTFGNIKFYSIIIDEALVNFGTYKGDSALNLSMFIHKLPSSDSSVFGLFSKKVIINNSHFILFDQNIDYNTAPNTMDYANIDIDSIYIDANNFALNNDSINFKANNLRANEKSGINIKKMSSDIIIYSKGIYTNNAILELNNSQIDADFGLEYSSFATMGEFIDSVNMIADVRPTTIDMADIGFFADIMYQMPNIIGITGKMNGTVSDLHCNNLKVKFAKNTRVSGNVQLIGLPDFYNTNMIGSNLFITTNTHDINKFYLPIDDKHFDFENIIKPTEQLTVKGSFDGYFKNFESDLKLITSYGEIASKVKFKQQTNDSINFEVTAIGDTVNIGGFLKQTKTLGKVSFNVSATGQGKSANEIKYGIIANLTDVDLLDYNYKKINITGTYFNDSVIAKFIIDDKNLALSATATAHLMAIPVFTLNSNVLTANFNQLNIFDYKNINLSTHIKAKVVGADINTLNADVYLLQNKININNQIANYEIDSIALLKYTDTLGTKLSLKSKIVKANINGQYNLSTLTQSIFKLTNNYFNILPVSDTSANLVDKNASIDIDIIKPRIFNEHFVTGGTLSANTVVNSYFNFTQKTIDLALQSRAMRIGTTKLDSVDININSINDSLICELSIANIIMKDSTATDSLVIGVDDFSLSAKIKNDSIIYGINWDNRIQKLKNLGLIEGFLAYTPDSTKFKIISTDIFINDIKWNIDTNNLTVYKNNRVFFKDIIVNANKSQFKLIGTIPKNDGDSLVARFTNWELSTFDAITKTMNFELDGLINGSLSYSLIEKNPTLISDINIKDLKLNNEYLGDAHIYNTWDNATNSIFIKSDIVRQGNVGKGEVFLANGYYHPFQKGDNLNIDVSFDKFKIKSIEPFVNSFVTDLEGSTSGKLKIRGSVLKPVITGSVDMQRTAMRIVYLNTKYSFSNSIDFVKNGINFDNLVIYDTLGNKADIDGSLNHNYFKKPMFDVVISTPGLLFFNTTQNMNNMYYGSAVASGDIKIKGSPDDIDLFIDIQTQKGTSVTLPLDYSVEISDKDYIIFTKPTLDSITELQKVKKIEAEDVPKSNLNYNIGVKLAVTPVAQVGISLPEDMGTIEARGNSNIALDVSSNGNFSLIGDYVVDNGLFHFKIGNLVSKKFTLVKGGRISWTGSPYSARVNIKGLYKVKTSLSSLGIAIDTSASYKNKVTVDCYVVLTNELLNPTIKFEIDLPNLDPDLQRLVYSELDTTNAAIMNQQMISLLVLGSFSFNNASNVSLQSSYYNVIANQLSSMLSQISDNVDIGLNYKPGDNVSQEEFEVALSTQLFNDRLTIDGNFGMTYDRSQQSASNIVGDVDIGYKLTPDGQWILKVFNHSNVNSWYNYNNYDQISPYTQGVGIAFVRNFNNISELFESRRKKKKVKM